MRGAIKLCCKCKIEKPTVDFCKNKTKKDGINSRCRLCASKQTLLSRQLHPERVSEQWKRYQKANPEALKSRKLKNRYGIDLVEYNRMFLSQEGCCLICEVHQSKLNKKLSVDHCHNTGRVRGLLCYKCNTIIGLANDNTKTLQSAINYLK